MQDLIIALLGLACAALIITVLFIIAVNAYFTAKERFIDNLMQKGTRSKDDEGK